MIKQPESECRKDIQTAKAIAFLPYGTVGISRASPVVSDVVENPVATVYHGHHHALDP